MKTAIVIAIHKHNEFIFDSEQDNEEVIMDFYNKRIKDNPEKKIRSSCRRR